MKNVQLFKFKFVGFLVLMLIVVSSCEERSQEVALHNAEEKNSASATLDRRNLSEEFKSYWYAGQAELTSYDLVQERYGELREGTAVTIFVTEDFLPDVQVKADRSSEDNIPVLKLNSTKKFLTGVYPYSIMTSSFVPVDRKSHALKVTHSMQEWCGHVYIQLNNKKKYEVTAHSYFEGEADREFSLNKTWLEDEIWGLIRINPEELPTGTIDMIPSFEFTRLRHKDLKSQKVEASIRKSDSMITTYTLHYPNLDRTLSIYFGEEFPHQIEGWKETMPSWGANATMLSNEARRKKQILSPYWTKNKNKDIVLRDSLRLK